MDAHLLSTYYVLSPFEVPGMQWGQGQPCPPGFTSQGGAGLPARPGFLPGAATSPGLHRARHRESSWEQHVVGASSEETQNTKGRGPTGRPGAWRGLGPAGAMGRGFATLSRPPRASPGACTEQEGRNGGPLPTNRLLEEIWPPRPQLSSVLEPNALEKLISPGGKVT